MDTPRKLLDAALRQIAMVTRMDDGLRKVRSFNSGEFSLPSHLHRGKKVYYDLVVSLTCKSGEVRLQWLAGRKVRTRLFPAPNLFRASQTLARNQ